MKEHKRVRSMLANTTSTITGGVDKTVANEL